MKTISITYNGYKIKVFNNGKQVKTIILRGRDPIVIRDAIVALYNKGV